PPQTYETIYRNGPDVILAGATQPAGTAEEIGAGAWQVNGHWPFASGCQHADWIAGFCVANFAAKNLLSERAPAAPLVAAAASAIAPAVTAPAPPSARQPHIRAVFLPARDWQIEDTWYAAGLKGTGSHHVVLKDNTLPAANFADRAGGVPFVPRPLYVALPQFLALLHAASALGMAEGVVGNLIDLAATGRRQMQSPMSMRDSEVFQFELGRVAADLRAARAF